MKYLNYEGLLHYTTKIKEYIESKILHHIFDKTKSEVTTAPEEGVVYFTSDTHEIIKDGVSYGGTISTENVELGLPLNLGTKVLKELDTQFYPATHVDAVVGITKHSFDNSSSTANSKTDDVIYFTTDSKLIIRNGVVYGESLATTQAGTASDQVPIKTVTEETVAFYPKTHVDAVEGLLKHDFDSLTADVDNQNDGVVYFTTDSKLIIRNGISYGGSITAEDVNTVQDEGIMLRAVTFVQDCTSESNSSFTIKPNYKYIFGLRSALTISLEPVTDSTIVNHYMFEFTSGSTATTLSLPASIKWATSPSIKPNKIYLISIENNLGIIQEWT